MRGRAVALALVAACGSASQPPHAARAHKPKPLVAVIGLEAVPDDADTRAAAHALTDQLRATLSPEWFRLARSRDDLVDMKQLASCHNDAPSCMADIGEFLDADFMIYGKLERRGDALFASLDFLDVHARFNRRAARVRLTADRAATALDAFRQLGVSP
jgi:DNA-binding FadR family transcriptional regulator